MFRNLNAHLHLRAGAAHRYVELKVCLLFFPCGAESATNREPPRFVFFYLINPRNSFGSKLTFGSAPLLHTSSCSHCLSQSLWVDAASSAALLQESIPALLINAYLMLSSNHRCKSSVRASFIYVVVSSPCSVSGDVFYFRVCKLNRTFRNKLFSGN